MFKYSPVLLLALSLIHCSTATDSSASSAQTTGNTALDSAATVEQGSSVATDMAVVTPAAANVAPPQPMVATTEAKSVTPNLVAGFVAGTVNNSIDVQANLRSLTSPPTQSLSSCANALVRGYGVGLGSVPLATSTVQNDGSFYLDFNFSSALASTGLDVVLQIDCNTSFHSTIWCYGHSNHNNLVCDPIISAAVEYLHSVATIGSLIGNSNLSGSSVSSLVQTISPVLISKAQNDPTDTTLSLLNNANNVAQAMQIIENSAASDLLTTVVALMSQTVAYNLNSSNLAAVAAGFREVWTVPQVFNSLVGLGVNIQILSNQIPTLSTLVYGGLGDLVDVMNNTNFFPALRSYLQQWAIDNSNFSSNNRLYCLAQNTDTEGSSINYFPDIFVTNNGNQVTCFGPTALALGLNSNSNAIIGLWYGIYPQELDRNTGTTTSVTTNVDLTMPLTEALPEVIDAIFETGGLCYNANIAAHLLDTNNPMNANDLAIAANCLRSKNLSGSFSGLYGIYQYFITPGASLTRFSLNDIYTSLVDNYWVRMSVNHENIPIFSPILVLDANINPLAQTNLWPSYILLDSNLPNPNITAVSAACMPPLCDSENGEYATSMTLFDVNAMLAISRPSFNSLFGSFLPFPTINSVLNEINYASQHSSIDAAGSPYFTILGKTSQIGSSSLNMPILCTLTNSGGSTNSGFSTGSSFSCSISDAFSSGLITSSTSTTILQNYSNQFGLRQVASSGARNYFEIVNLYSNASLSYGGKPLWIADIGFEANPVDANGNAIVADGSSLHNVLQTVCSVGQVDEGSFLDLQESCHTVNALYVALAFPNASTGSLEDSFYGPSSYIPYSWQIAPNQIPGVSNTSATLINVLVDQNSTPYPVCLNGNAVNVSFIAPTTVYNVVLNANTIGSCANLSEPFYYLTLPSNNNVTVENAYKYQFSLVRSDGIPMVWPASACVEPLASNFYCSATVSLGSLMKANSNMVLGPNQTTAATSTYYFPNPSNKPNYYPYCLDVDTDGTCDCIHTDPNSGVVARLTASTNPNGFTCGVLDGLGYDLGLQQSPVLLQSPQQIWLSNVLQNCASSNGNLSFGSSLSSCLTNMISQDSNSLFYASLVNWQDLVLCTNGATLSGEVSFNSLLSTPQLAGPGCGQPNSLTNSFDAGPVNLYNYLPRANVYSVGRPNSELQLYGVGAVFASNVNNLDANTAIFTLPDAIALSYMRLAMPIDGLQVYGPLFADPSQTVPYTLTKPYLTSFSGLGAPASSIPGALLKTYLNKQSH